MHVLDFKTKSVQSLVQNQENIFALTSLHVAKANGIFTLLGTGTGTGIVNGTSTTGNNESWCLSLSQTSMNISMK